MVDELLWRVQHPDGGSVLQRFVEELGACAIDEALLGHDADDVRVHQPEAWLVPLGACERVGVAAQRDEPVPLPG
jgi:hypothetical protein